MSAKAKAGAGGLFVLLLTVLGGLYCSSQEIPPEPDRPDFFLGDVSAEYLNTKQAELDRAKREFRERATQAVTPVSVQEILTPGPTVAQSPSVVSQRTSTPYKAPVAIIQGPTEAKVGDLIILDSSPSQGDAFAWVSVDTQNCIEWPDGKKLIFATGTAGTYNFLLAAFSWEDGKVTTSIARHSVDVGSLPGPPTPPPPGPGPGPQPPPDPDPVPLPDGRYKLAASAWTWANSLPASAKAKAEAVANGFDAVAAQIAAGVIQDMHKAAEAMSAANNNAMGSERQNWTPFLQALDARLSELWDKKELVNVSDMADAFREVAIGLRAIKGRVR